MIRHLGILGIVGVLIALAGLAVIAIVDPLIAVGVAAILVGFGLVIGTVIRRALASFGLGGMV